MLAWPHAGTDWAPRLEQAQRTWTDLATAILGRERLLLLCTDDDHEQAIRRRLTEAGAELSRLHVRHLEYDDTWARDFGPIAVADDDGPCLLDFRFNGWGGKFPSQRDDAVSSQIRWRTALEPQELVFEGGSMDTDGRGTLLTTAACLLNPNRNPELDQAALESRLGRSLGVQRFLWLQQGALEGDDTDAHVDTLARFCNESAIAYVQCEDSNDSHYPALHAMEKELRAIASQYDYELIPLPLPPACHDDDGHRLPATYANFLIINDAVLVPVYGEATDVIALERLTAAFPDRQVEGVNCRELIRQHGSLHCVTMQLPDGVL